MVVFVRFESMTKDREANRERACVNKETTNEKKRAIDFLLGLWSSRHGKGVLSFFIIIF